MRLRNRFLLVGLGVVLFVLATPILVLYARGFKIDFENRKLIKTGTLVINSEPTKAEIFLNDIKYNDVTDANVRFLLPGNYSIRIEKEHYQSWTKRLSVKSELVTWANNGRNFITLFLKQPILDQTLNPTNTTDIFPEPKTPLTEAEIQELKKNLNVAIPEFTTIELVQANSQLYLILDQTLYLVNDKLEKIYAPVTKVGFEQPSNTLLYSNSNEIYIFYPESKNSDLILRSQTPIKNPILNNETGYVFYQNESKIKAIELDGRDHRNIYSLTEAQNEFIVSKDGKKLYTRSPNEILEYTIR